MESLAQKIGENTKLKKEIEELKQLVPPVSLGDKLYRIDDEEVVELRINSITRDKSGAWLFNSERTDGDYMFWMSLCGSCDNIGRCYFRTKEEAEAALEQGD